MAERKLGDVVRQFDRQSRVMPKIKWFADVDRAKGLLEFAKLSPKDRVLEVGCGPGLVLQHAGAMSHTAVGLDVSPGMLREARARAPRALVLRGMVERLPFRDNSFDIAYCRSVLHHVLDPAAMVRAMARVVRHGGRVVVNDSVASEDSTEARNHNLVEVLRDPSHGRMVPPSEMRTFFADAGLRIVEVHARKYERDLEDWLSVTRPPREQHDHIVALFEVWVKEDASGFRPRKEAGRIRFEHTQWTIRAEKP